MSVPLEAALGVANHSLSTILARIRQIEGGAVKLEPNELIKIVKDLLAATGLVQERLNAIGTSGVTPELVSYRKNLEQLELLLPKIHAQLLAYKCNIRAAQERAASAACWARAAEKTL